MKKLNCRYFVYIVLMVVFLCRYAYGQTSEVDKAKMVYLDLNTADKAVIHEIQLEQLGIQYNDRYGRLTEMEFKIYDWRRQIVSRFSLAKTFGLNHFTIKLDEVYNGWEKGRLYMCEATDEVGNKYELVIRPVNPAKSEIHVNILVNPKYMKCDELSGNLVEFYGQIDGGKPPYTINWYVLNEQRSGFFYQPKQQYVDREGATAAIQVDKSPSYYVILDVHDACGNEQYQVVTVVCRRKKKKVNTVFFESIQDLVNKKIIN